MTLKNRLSKLEASILPEVRPPKVVVIEGYRDGEDMDVARDRHFAAHPRTGVRPSWFSFERCWATTMNDVIDIALPHTGWKPRAHQKKLWRYLARGGKRRSGKHRA